MKELFLNNVIVTGGCIPSLFRHETPNDYDMYFRSAEVAEVFCKMGRYMAGANESAFAVTMPHLETQFITAFHGTPEDVVSRFDFLHATSYWTRETGLVVPGEVRMAIDELKLIYRPNEYPLSSLLRVHKFLLRGYEISLSNMLKIVLQLQKYDLTDADTLVKQTRGIDPDQIERVLESIKSHVDNGGVINVDSVSEFVDSAWGNPF